MQATTNSIQFRSFIGDLPISITHNLWTDTISGSFNEEKLYVVQTNPKVVERCLLMTTDPGDLVLDPTCGSGTTAYVAEQWGRRWITCDTSRVPLALARQRLLTATFDYYQINPVGGVAASRQSAAISPTETAALCRDAATGTLPNSPANGFVYRRKQNQKGEEVGGIVPHITLKSIAPNNEPPAEEVLVDRPEIVKGVVRVTGPFTFEATIPTAEGLDTEPDTPGMQGESHEQYVQRMLEVLRRAPVLRLPGNQTVTLKNIRPPAKTLALSAEAVLGFGPENGPLSQRLVREAWDEAGLIPTRAASDAIHIGYAAAHEMDFLLTWNCRHILNKMIERRLAAVCTAMGLSLPVLCTPSELMATYPEL